MGRGTSLGKVEGQRPNKGLCDQGRLHGNRQASGTRGGRAHQAFVTRGGTVPRGHCDVGPCHVPGRSKSLMWSLPGEQLSEEAAASLEATTPLRDCGQCSSEHSHNVEGAAGECPRAAPRGAATALPVAAGEGRGWRERLQWDPGKALGQRQPGLAPGLALRRGQRWHGPGTAMPQGQRAQLGTQPSLAAVASTCLGARAGLAGTWGTPCPHSRLHPAPPPASHR